MIKIPFDRRFSSPVSLSGDRSGYTSPWLNGRGWTIGTHTQWNVYLGGRGQFSSLSMSGSLWTDVGVLSEIQSWWDGSDEGSKTGCLWYSLLLKQNLTRYRYLLIMYPSRLTPRVSLLCSTSLHPSHYLMFKKKIEWYVLRYPYPTFMSYNVLSLRVDLKFRSP